MKPAHKSNAGQIVNQDKTIQVLSDYIKQAKASEEEFLKKPKTFDEWLDEPWVRYNKGEPWLTRRDFWEPSEIDAAKQAWEACEKTLSSKA